jgi:uncharacterized protein (TIGR02284 family)
MLDSDKKPVDVLNHLIVINNDRLVGYDQASNETDIAVLKALFARLKETSMECRNELCKEVYKLGGRPVDEIGAPGDFGKAWTEINAALSTNNHQAILDSCYVEEFMAIKSYEYAVRYFQNCMTTQHKHICNKHKELIGKDFDKVKNLRHILINS